MTRFTKQKGLEYLTSHGLAISPSTYLRLVKSGRIKGEYGDGNSYLVEQSELDRYINEVHGTHGTLVLIIDGMKPQTPAGRSDISIQIETDSFWTTLCSSVYPKLTPNAKPSLRRVTVSSSTPQNHLQAIAGLCQELNKPLLVY